MEIFVVIATIFVCLLQNHKRRSSATASQDFFALFCYSGISLYLRVALFLLIFIFTNSFSFSVSVSATEAKHRSKYSHISSVSHSSCTHCVIRSKSSKYVSHCFRESYTNKQSSSYYILNTIQIICVKQSQLFSVIQL